MTVETDIEAIVHRDLADPHRLLGAHPHNGGVVVRAFRPAAAKVLARPEGGEPVELTQRHPAGLFEGEVAGATLPLRYELEVEYAPGESYTMRDPYAFPPTLGEIDLYLAGEGRHEELYEKLGAHVAEIDGATGVAFAVWAPSARSVSVVGDFNSWDGRLHPMRSLGASGIWELFIPGVPEGSRYKFELRAPGRRHPAARRPVRLRGRAAAQDGLGRQPHALRVDRRRLDGAAPAGRPAARSRCRSTRSTSAPGG